jgi:hypothetical protein
MLSLVESRLHGFLKKVGMAFLFNMGCFLVDAEVPLTMFGQRRLHDLDGRHVIDVCGVGERFYTPKRGTADDDELRGHKYELKQNILRGIEVKVTRSDFRNGFVCSGCNYNYILTPMRLVAPSEVPRGVGIIEYNKYKFSVEMTEEDGFTFKGLRVVKKPSFRRIHHYQVDNATAHMVRRSKGEGMESLIDDLLQSHSSLSDDS